MYRRRSSSSSSSDEEPEIVVRRRKVYRKRINKFFEYDDSDFFDRFRLTKPTTLCLFNQIQNDIKLPTNRAGCIQPMIQLLLALRFYATGSMLLVMGDFMGVSKASRIVKRVSHAIAALRPRYIKMPESAEDMQQCAEEFYNIASFPRVIGAIDGSLIPIQSPGGHDAEVFRSRKSFFALNVQTVSDAHLKIRDIVARWPGSTHDQTIFNNSSLKYQFEDGRFGRYLLVGDSGYSIQPYLMIKLQTVDNRAENLYNESIIRTRNVVERQYGLWKRRFPILTAGIRLQLETAMVVIVATAVVHNMAIDMLEDIPQEWLEPDVDVERELDDNINDPHVHNRGRQIRQLIINDHFARL